MTNEEMKKHVRSTVDMFNDLAINEQLDALGLAYMDLGCSLATAKTRDDTERQLEILTDISKHREGIRASIFTLCAAIKFGVKSEFLKDIVSKQKQLNHDRPDNRSIQG